MIVGEQQSYNVARFLSESANAYPEKCALKVPKKRGKQNNVAYSSFSFRELNDQCQSVAVWLKVNDVGKGSKVLVMVKPGQNLIEIVFALFMLGAVPVVIDPGMGIRNFLKCVQRTKPDVLIGIWTGYGLSVFYRSIFSSIQKRILITDKRMYDVRNQFKGESIACDVSKKEDVAAILFTSGSTGAPKGVLYEHGMFEAQVRLIKNQYAIEAGEVDFPMLPIFALFNPALGMTTVVPEMNPSRPAKANPAKLAQAINQEGITSSFGSPVLWNNIAQYCLKHNISLPSLKRILMAGAPVPTKLYELYEKVAPNATVHSPYGATECLPIASISQQEVLSYTRKKTEQGKGTCVGYPLPEIEIKIINKRDGLIFSTEDCSYLPVNTVGEIIVKGPVVTRAYHELPEATSKAKIKDGDTVWHRMGDLGYLDDDGRLWFCGRMAEAVETVNGPLYTDCIEPIFNQHPWVCRSALIGRGEKGPAIVVQPLPKHYPKSYRQKKRFAEKLRMFYADKMNAPCEIQHFFFKRKLPVDVRHNAKIHRLALGRLYE